MSAEPNPARQADGSGRIAVIVGSGALPKAVVETLRLKGEDPFLVVVAGDGALDPTYATGDHIELRAEEIGLLMPALARARVGRLVMAGGVSARPRLHRARITWSLIRWLPRLAAGLARGDDGLLRALMGIVEAEGIAVVGAHEIVPELLAPEGLLTRAAPTGADQRDIDAASVAALAIGRLDIGQAAVAIGGRCIALEGIEGTDGLLQRTAALRSHGRLAGRTRGVIVKHCKPTQDLRADLPAIGPQTIEAAHAAGLVGVAVEAGRSFILDFERTIALADERGLFVIGLSAKGQGA